MRGELVLLLPVDQGRCPSQRLVPSRGLSGLRLLLPTASQFGLVCTLWLVNLALLCPCIMIMEGSQQRQMIMMTI